MELQAVQILSLLAAVALLAVPASRGASLCAVAGFVAAAPAVLALSPAPPAVALVTAAAAAVALARPEWLRGAALCGGALAALSAALLHGRGLPWAVALPATALAGTFAYRLAGARAGFALPRTREEALLLVGTLGLLAAVGPPVVEGWETALALRTTPLEPAGVSSGAWLAASVAGCVAAGGAFALWRRRL